MDPQSEHDDPDILRVCVIGAESTGKTTLCMDLAEHYGIPFLPEFGRFYTEAMPDARRYTWTSDDFIVIAEAQNRFEDDAARWIGDLLLCDTNSFVTSVFHEAYLGSRSDVVEQLAASRDYDLYVLCDLDTPFVQDDTAQIRRAGEQRRWMHDTYLSLLDAGSVPFIEANGDRSHRVRQVTARIEDLRPGLQPRATPSIAVTQGRTPDEPPAGRPGQPQ